jgi:hypothetical protein
MLHQNHRTNTLVGAMWQPSCYVLLGLILLVSGCASGPTKKTSSIKSAKNVQSSVAELSSRNQSLLGLYSAEIEAAADKIILESHSPEARRQALVWKAEAIPVLQTTLLNTDPVAAVVDTWAFLFQMKAYMERPAVKQGFGEFDFVVAETLKNMDAEMERLIQVAAPSANVADLRQRVGAWAEAHPIQAGLTGRQSADPDMIRKVGESDLGAMASLKALGESLGDLTARLDSYNVYLPKQARWQAELLLRDIARDPQVDAVMSNAVVLSNALAKTSSSMERMPETMEQAREAIRADVDGQRLAAQAFLRDERLQTLDAVRQERIATIAAMHNERLAATADFRGERQAVLDALHNEEAAVMNDVNAASEKALKDLDSRGRGLIDHFFLRALELVLLTLVLCSLVSWILLRRFMPRRPGDRGERLYDRAA